MVNNKTQNVGLTGQPLCTSMHYDLLCMEVAVFCPGSMSNAPLRHSHRDSPESLLADNCASSCGLCLCSISLYGLSRIRCWGPIICSGFFVEVW